MDHDVSGDDAHGGELSAYVLARREKKQSSARPPTKLADVLR